MLTLTWPGRERRSSVHAISNGVTISKDAYSGSESPADAQALMKKVWNKMRTRLLKEFSDLKFLLVVEPQTDGYPHFHVLVVGSCVIPKGILETVRSMWTYQYGLGNVDIRIPRWGHKGAVRYVMKYLTDVKKRSMPLPLNTKRYTSSHNLLITVKKKQQGRFTWYEMGFLESLDGKIVGYREIWTTHDERQFYKVNDEKVLRELCDWFDTRSVHVQLPLFDLAL
jgi:hypothetical protein